MRRRPKPRLAPAGPTISDQIRHALSLHVEGGVSIYRLGRMAGVDPSLISRFLSGRRGLTSPTLDRVAASLGLVLAPASSSGVFRPMGENEGGAEPPTVFR